MGQSPPGNQYTNYPSEYILVQGNADIKDGWVVPRIWTKTAMKTAESGDFILSVRAPAGTVAKTAFDVAIGRGVAALRGREFIFQYLSKLDYKDYWEKLSTGSTFESINSNDIDSLQLLLPNLSEQEAIGCLLHKIDSLITLHQRKQTDFLSESR